MLFVMPEPIVVFMHILSYVVLQLFQLEICKVQYFNSYELNIISY